MIETISVSLFGPALSFLLYENSKSKFGQEGFLLGEIIKKETKTITDNDQRQVNITRIIKIDSIIPCPHLQYFYSGVGKIDEEKIKSFLGDQASKVVAWYKYKPVSSFKLSFREKIIHKQLAELFDIPYEHFTCCLLITESSDNSSTHLYRQNFVRFSNHGFDQLPLHIVNLSDPNKTYKSAEPVSETFKQILKDLKIDHKRSQGLTIISKIQNALQKHADAIVDDLAKAESRLYDLENEVTKLKEMKSVDNNVPNGANNSDINGESQVDIMSKLIDNSTDKSAPTRGKMTARGGSSGGKKKVSQNKKKASMEIETEPKMRTRSKN